MMEFYGSDITTSKDLGVGVLNFTTSVAREWKLSEVLMHFSIASTETITLTLDAAAGNTYDTVLATYSIVGKQSYIFRPIGDCVFKSGDELNVYCTNAGAAIVYVTVKRKELP